MKKKITMSTAKRVSLEDGCNMHLENCKQRNLREGTIRHYKDSYVQFMKFFSADMPLCEMTERKYYDYVSYLKGRLDSDISVQTYSRDLRTVLYFLMREGYVRHFKVKEIKVDKHAIETYTEDELMALLKKPNVKKCRFLEYQAWVMTNFLFSTGLRQRSLIHLQIRDVDLYNAVVNVKVTKNRKPLIIPLNRAMMEILKEFLRYRQCENKEAYLFCNAYGEQLRKSTHYAMMSAYNRIPTKMEGVKGEKIMILVTGANGFVGHKIMQLCKDTLACPSLRGATEDEIKRIVEESGADVIIHTAAISDIGTCQANPDASYQANVQIPVYLAKAAKHTKLICFSSDQVYSGLEEEGPYKEDKVKPANTYAAHKIEMEQRVLDIAPDAVMLRAEWMYDYYLEKSNYFMNILRAEDSVCFSSRQFRGITYVKEVAENMENVMKLPGGAYNFGSETTKSMYDITMTFLAEIGKLIKVEDAPPRHNLWMNCEKARKRGVDFMSVENGLRACAKDYGLLIDP